MKNVELQKFKSDLTAGEHNDNRVMNLLRYGTRESANKSSAGFNTPHRVMTTRYDVMTYHSQTPS